MNSTSTMGLDWSIGHSLEFYKRLYYCTSFILPGLLFFLFPIFAIICHCCLSPKINKKPTESVGDNFVGCEKWNREDNKFKKCCDTLRDCKRNCSCECTCNCGDILNCFCLAECLLNLTIAISQFLFGATNVQLKDKISYKERCIKIGSRYYELSLYTLLPLVWSNACVLVSLIAVFCAFTVIKETDSCDESLDCFLADESDKTKITDCSMIREQRIKVKCFEISRLQFFYALSFIGGLLKFEPIIFKAVIFFYLNKLSEKSKCCRIFLFLVNASVILLFIAAFGVWSVVLFMSPGQYHRLRHFFFAFLQSIMKRLGLVMALVAQVGSMFLYPWQTLHEKRIMQKDLKTSVDRASERPTPRSCFY